MKGNVKSTVNTFKLVFKSKFIRNTVIIVLLFNFMYCHNHNFFVINQYVYA